MKLQTTASWMLILTLFIIMLIYGEPVLVPFVIALLIWFVVKKMRNLIDKSYVIRKYIPKWVKTVLASLLIFGAMFFIGQILTTNIESLANSYTKYLPNIELISTRIGKLLAIDVNSELTNFIHNIEFSGYLNSLFNSISEILGNMLMIIFYVIFLFIEETLFENKIKLIFTDETKYQNVLSTLNQVDKSMSSYISLKSLISLITTTLSYFILLSVGIDSPLFWAFLIFIFNFIPSVGPILATVFPALFSLIQFGEFVPFFAIIFGVGGVSLLVGSLVEPKLMGNTLNISPLVAIISLAIWGSIWGIVGMLLCVPITVALIIILSQFQQTRSIAILLSERGKV